MIQSTNLKLNFCFEEPWELQSPAAIKRNASKTLRIDQAVSMWSILDAQAHGLQEPKSSNKKKGTNGNSL